jgi:hypothetical protein
MPITPTHCPVFLRSPFASLLLRSRFARGVSDPAWCVHVMVLSLSSYVSPASTWSVSAFPFLTTRRSVWKVLSPSDEPVTAPVSQCDNAVPQLGLVIPNDTRTVAARLHLLGLPGADLEKIDWTNVSIISQHVVSIRARLVADDQDGLQSRNVSGRVKGGRREQRLG